ncbi:F-type H+-transporting ATPase subunit delta [Natranaerovirga pectinivora]|uniref:ATP synthase subunit delta n=1 Tax=Natranaerovirga pectinivora TaxID=682400 RepID=A0A4R3MK66_9FIRM|nr:ATP synthase F1 subunit delta [Natranaerovirga pectinivora]TCT13088.1 F-type H+-transporting ATPase subunit delta [Natranaerovirga pectinivora]
MAQLVVKTYSRALFQLAQEENIKEKLEEESIVILDVLKNNEDFLTLLNHPKISKDEKISIFEESFVNLSNELLGLMSVIIKKDRYMYIIDILKDFLEIIKEDKGIVTASVFSAKELDEKQKAKIEQRLENLTNKKVETVYTVDQSLVGGLKIRIGDRIVDNSIKGRIDLMAKELLKIQLA